MIPSIKIFGYSVYLQTLAYTRVKESFFFSFIFPVFLFVLFNLIWGGTSDRYVYHLFTGVIGMTIASDALFSIGPVIRSYKVSNLLKFLRNLPMNVLLHFLGLFISRIMAVFIAIVLISLVSALLFDYVPTPRDILFLVAGTLVGTTLFACLGLFIAFFSKPEAGRGITNFLYFLMIFTSGAFYSVEIMPDILRTFSEVIPLTHLLRFLRGETIYLVHLGVWTVLFAFLFYVAFNRVQIKR